MKILKETFVLNSEYYSGYKFLKLKKDYTETIFHNLGFGNCQNFVGNKFKYFLFSFNNSRLFLTALYEVYQCLGKKILTIDVQRYVANITIDILNQHNIKHNVLHYISTNHSEMSIIMIYCNTIDDSLEDNEKLSITIKNPY